jgi:hypothetical protein
MFPPTLALIGLREHQAHGGGHEFSRSPDALDAMRRHFGSAVPRGGKELPDQVDEFIGQQSGAVNPVPGST